MLALASSVPVDFWLYNCSRQKLYLVGIQKSVPRGSSKFNSFYSHIVYWWRVSNKSAFLAFINRSAFLRKLGVVVQVKLKLLYSLSVDKMIDALDVLKKLNKQQLLCCSKCTKHTYTAVQDTDNTSASSNQVFPIFKILLSMQCLSEQQELLFLSIKDYEILTRKQFLMAVFSKTMAYSNFKCQTKSRPSNCSRKLKK